MIIYTFISYFAISIHMTMIKEFGGISTVLVGNARKALTIILSFVLFPKPGSIFYILGGILVFGGLTLNAYSKEMKWGKKISSKHSDTELTKQVIFNNNDNHLNNNNNSIEEQQSLLGESEKKIPL